MVGTGFIPPFVFRFKRIMNKTMTSREQKSNYRLMLDYILRSANPGLFSSIYSHNQHCFVFAR